MASGAWFILGFLWTVEALSSLQVSVTGDGTTSTESHRLGSYLWSQNSTNANCSWDNREPMMRSSDFQTLCRSTGNSQSSFVCAAMWDEFGARHAKSGDVVCVGRKLQFILSSSSLRLMADCTWTLDPDGLQIKRIDDSEVPMPIILSPDPPEASVDEEHMGTVLAHAFHDGASPFNIIMDALMAFLHLVSLDADITKTRVLAIPNRKNAASTYRLAHELFKTVFSRAEPMILPGDTEQHFFAEQLVVPSTAQLPLRRDRPGLVDVWPHCRYWPALQGFASFLKDGFHVRPIPDSQFSPHALILVDKPINLADQTDTPFPRDLKASLKAKAGIRSTVLNTMEMSAAELVRMFSMANIIVSEIAPTMELVILTMPCAEILEICRNGFDEFTEYFIQADRTKRCVNAKSDEDVDPVAIDLETAILEAQIRFDKCVGNRFKFARELQHEATAAKATREAQARAKEIAEQQATQSRQAVESLQAEADMINQLAGQAGGPLAEALRKTLGAASGRQAPCPKIITTKTATTQAPGEGGGSGSGTGSGTGSGSGSGSGQITPCQPAQIPTLGPAVPTTQALGQGGQTTQALGQAVPTTQALGQGGQTSQALGQAVPTTQAIGQGGQATQAPGQAVPTIQAPGQGGQATQALGQAVQTAPCTTLGPTVQTTQAPGQGGQTTQALGQAVQTTQALGQGGQTTQAPGQAVQTTQAIGQGGQTTQAPGQAVPTTQAPGQGGQTTQAPGQAVPATQAPGQGGQATQALGQAVQTAPCTTLGPTVPATQAPGQAVPTTQAPGQGGQTTQAPGQAVPTTQAPGQAVPTTQAPGQGGQTTQAPGQVLQTTQAPGQAGQTTTVQTTQAPGQAGTTTEQADQTTPCQKGKAGPTIEVQVHAGQTIELPEQMVGQTVQVKVINETNRTETALRRISQAFNETNQTDSDETAANQDPSAMLVRSHKSSHKHHHHHHQLPFPNHQ